MIAAGMTTAWMTAAMTDAPAIDTADEIDRAETGTPAIGDFLDDERVVIDLEVSSRKRLFEQMAKLLSSPEGGPDVDTVLHTLTKREKLGCTAIGNGVALPHGRIEGLAEPVISVARLRHAISYDAPDGVPVWLAVCLLVPAEANQTHLQLLAALAARFNTPGFPVRLRQAQTATELTAHFKATHFQDEQVPA